MFRKMLPKSLFQTIFRDMVECLVLSNEEQKGQNDFEKVGGLLLSLLSGTGTYCPI
jgi:hypothetical protein